MDIKGLGNFVAKSAPVLGAALTASGVGAPVGLILSGLGALFGGSSDPDKIYQNMQGDPEASLKLRQYELQHEEVLYNSVVNDRISARERESNIVKATGKRDWVLDSIALFMIIGFFSLTVFLCFSKIDNSVQDVLYILIGQMSGSFVLVMSYYFGSSVPIKQGPIVLPPPAQTR